ncbi:MAG: hypothetical protein H6P95_1883, partial [Candidatus Aminicenantes bacterium]|nr:hypothetical protein [Candidatus Aminicenantes bacterium]
MKRSARATSLKVLVLMILVLPLAFTSAGAAGAKKPISYDAYNGWRAIQGS